MRRSTPPRGVLAAPTIAGLVEAATRLALAGKYAAPLALALELAISVGYAVAAELPGGGARMGIELRGLPFGLSAAVLGWTLARPRDSAGPAEERR